MVDYSTGDFALRCVRAQEAYCERENLPCFTPPYGICPSCARPIFGEDPRYTLEQASNFLVTSCPCCARSFVD